MHDGVYAQLGQDGATVYLQGCRGPASVDSVNLDEVLSRTGVTEPDGLTASVIGIVFQHQPAGMGYRLPC